MEFLGIIHLNPESFNVWTLRIAVSLTTTIFILACVTAVRAFLYIRGTDLSHLNRIKDEEMSSDDRLMESVAKILWTTSRNEAAEGQPAPKPFLHDATRQVAENIFNGKYLTKISMCSNMLPPIGLWGTVAGMIVIFLYTGDPGNALNKGAIGTKLWSTFLALIYYVSLEGICLLLGIKARKSIDRGLNVEI